MLTIFCGDLPHHLDLQVQLGEQLLQTGVLLGQALDLLDFVNGHPGKPLAPAIDTLLRHVVSFGHFGHRIFIRFPQDPDDLLVAVSVLLHCSLLNGNYLLKFQLVRKSQDRSLLAVRSSEQTNAAVADRAVAWFYFGDC